MADKGGIMNILVQAAYVFILHTASGKAESSILVSRKRF